MCLRFQTYIDTKFHLPIRKKIQMILCKKKTEPNFWCIHPMWTKKVHIKDSPSKKRLTLKTYKRFNTDCGFFKNSFANFWIFSDAKISQHIPCPTLQSRWAIPALSSAAVSMFAAFWRLLQVKMHHNLLNHQITFRNQRSACKNKSTWQTCFWESTFYFVALETFTIKLRSFAFFELPKDAE